MMRLLSLLAVCLLAGGASALCTNKNTCSDCVAAFSAILTGCVWCPGTGGAGQCLDPYSAVRQCSAVSFNSDQCASSTTVSTSNPGQRAIAINADCTSGSTCTFISAGLSSGTASALIFRGVKGGASALFANFPAVNVKSASATKGEGATFFDFGMVIEGVAEWGDADSDGKVTLSELSHPVLFNTGYTWAFQPAHGNGFWSIALTGTSTTTGPQVVANCTIPDRNALQLGAMILDSNDLKCDLEVTGLSLADKSHGWAMRLFLVSGTKDVVITGKPATATGSGSTAGSDIDLGGGGSFSWVGHAGHSRGMTDIDVTWTGGTAAGASWTGTLNVDASQSFFGFANPTPGTDFDIYWDPTIAAPDQSSAAGVAASLFTVALTFLAAFMQL